MAEDTEKVEYSFEGNVESLREATQEAISLLHKYDGALKKAASSDVFKASVSSVTDFQKAVDRISSAINSLVKTYNKAGDSFDSEMSSSTSVMTSACKDLSDTLEYLSSATTLTSSDFRLMTSILKDTKTSLDSVVSKATILSSSVKKVSTDFKSSSEQITSSTEDIKKAAEDTSEAVADVAKTEIPVEPVVPTEPFTAVVTESTEAKGAISKFGDQLITLQQKLASVGESIRGFFDPITSKMQSFASKASTAFASVSKTTSTVASAFRRVKQSTESSEKAADDSAKAHESLGDATKKIASKVAEETKAITGEKRELNSKNKTLKDSKKSHDGLFHSLKGLGRQFQIEISRMRTFTPYVKILNNSSNVLRKTFGALTGIAIGDWLAAATEESISYIENLNLFTVAMGNATERGLEFVDTMAELYGMDPSNLYRYSGYFYQLTDAVNMSSEASASLSLSLTKASNDIASLFNLPIEQVVENLASGLQGMSRAVRKYGMDIRATTLQQTAYEYGLTDQVETMSEANRMALRYITMIEQVSNALKQTTTDIEGATSTMGDFARNIETPANQLRIFKEQITQLGRSIGNFILVPLKEVIAYINGFIMALRKAINFVASLFGILDTTISSVDTSNITNAVDAVGESADEASEKVKSLTAPFDELNIIQEQSTATNEENPLREDTIDPGLQEAIENMELSLDNVRMKANEIRDAILEFFGFKIDLGEIISWDSNQFENNLISKFPQWTKTIQATFDNWSAIIEGFKAVFSSIGGVIDNIVTKLLNFFGLFINDTSVSTFIENLAGNLQSLSDWITNNEETLSNLALVLLSVVGAFAAFNALSPIVSLITTFGSTILSLLSPFASFIGIAAAVAGAIYLLYTNSQSFADSFQNFLGSIWEGLSTMGSAFLDTLSIIGDGFARLWNESIQPTLQSLGDAMAPILDTLSSLWMNFSNVVADVFTRIGNLWTTTLEPVLKTFFTAIQNLCDIFKSLWVEFVGPVIEHIGNGLQELWTNAVGPVFEKIIEVIGTIIEYNNTLWNTFVAPFIKQFVEVWGPAIKSVLQTIWDVIQQTFEDIFNIIEGLLQAIQGIFDFLIGVFTGDWERAWKGIVNIFVGVGNSIISIFETAMNGGISLVNMSISFIYNALVGFINNALSMLSNLAGLIGIDLDLEITAPPPAIPYVNIPRIPEMARGGIVTSPTYALIGEGAYDEAVIPLGDSPQMEELVNRIANAVDKPDKNDSNDITVKVYIGDEEFDAFAYKASERGKNRVGAQPIRRSSK